MWQTFQEESAENKYGNNIKSTSIGKKHNNNKNQSIDKRAIEQHGAAHRALSNNKLQLQPLDPELGGLSASRLRADVPHERHTNMHSSAVVADSTAVIVNIGGCDQGADTNSGSRTNYNQQQTQQHLRGTNARVRRTSSGASYSEVAHRRERKISSSSQTSKYGNNQIRTQVSSPQQSKRQQTTRHLRAEQSSTQNVSAQHSRREQSPKPNESPSGLARRRHKLPLVSGSSTKLRQHSIDTTENANHNNKLRSRRQRDSSYSSSTASSCNGSCSSDDGESNSTSTSSGEPNLPYPGFPEIALKYLTQDTRPRNWCLMMITNPYPFFTNYTK